MSAAPNLRRPIAPLGRPVAPERPALVPVEVAPSRAQRRGRPRPFYATVTLGGVFAVVIAQLLLSLVVSNGAYELSTLASDRAALNREEQQLRERIDVYGSPQNLATEAEGLGMVANGSSAVIWLSNGAVEGNVSAAEPGSGVVGSHGNLVANSLLAQQAAAAAAGAATVAPSEPSSSSEDTPETATAAGDAAPTMSGLPTPATH